MSGASNLLAPSRSVPDTPDMPGQTQCLLNPLIDSEGDGDCEPSTMSCAYTPAPTTQAGTTALLETAAILLTLGAGTYFSATRHSAWIKATGQMTLAGALSQTGDTFARHQDMALAVLYKAEAVAVYETAAFSYSRATDSTAAKAAREAATACKKAAQPWVVQLSMPHQTTIEAQALLSAPATATTSLAYTLYRDLPAHAPLTERLFLLSAALKSQITPTSASFDAHVADLYDQLLDYARFTHALNQSQGHALSSTLRANLEAKQIRAMIAIGKYSRAAMERFPITAQSPVSARLMYDILIHLVDTSYALVIREKKGTDLETKLLRVQHHLRQGIATTAAKLGDWQTALEFKEAIVRDFDPRLTSTTPGDLGNDYAQLAQVDMKLGHFQTAETHLRAALKIYYAIPETNLSDSAKNTLRERLDKAYTLLFQSTVLQLDPSLDAYTPEDHDAASEETHAKVYATILRAVNQHQKTIISIFAKRIAPFIAGSNESPKKGPSLEHILSQFHQFLNCQSYISKALMVFGQQMMQLGDAHHQSHLATNIAMDLAKTPLSLHDTWENTHFTLSIYDRALAQLKKQGILHQIGQGTASNSWEALKPMLEHITIITISTLDSSQVNAGRICLDTISERLTPFKEASSEVAALMLDLQLLETLSRGNPINPVLIGGIVSDHLSDHVDNPGGDRTSRHLKEWYIQGLSRQPPPTTRWRNIERMGMDGNPRRRDRRQDQTARPIYKTSNGKFKK